MLCFLSIGALKSADLDQENKINCKMSAPKKLTTFDTEIQINDAGMIVYQAEFFSYFNYQILEKESITLSWSTLESADSYRIMMSYDGQNFQCIKEVSNLNTFKTAFDPRLPVYYQIEGKFKSGRTSESSPILSVKYGHFLQSQANTCRK
jgi:hypothetical protein